MKVVLKRLSIAVGGFAAVALAATAVTAAGAEEPPTTRESQWEELAAEVYANAEADYDELTASGQNVQSYHVAAVAWYAGQRFGWDDSRTQTWLQRTYDRATPTGGYGIGFAHDYFGDGTVNPADTTYSITTSWHVGRMLIDGHAGGGVPADKVVEAVGSVLDTEQTPNQNCAAYSTSGNDVGYPCIWNVGAASAWFLWKAYEQDLYPDGRGDEVLEKLRTWRNHVRAHYSTELGGWNYIEDGPAELDDPGHLGATVSAMYEADPSIGETALEAYWRHYTGTVSSVDLVYYDCSKVEATFAPVAEFALSDQGSTAKNMGLAAYAPVVQRVAAECGV
ncbi:MAG: hypothetical protein ACRDXX_03130 [Stackebrandtia sp.]